MSPQAIPIVRLVVLVPESHADIVRESIGQTGAGKIGHYKYCSFSIKGVARFIPEEGAHPAIGQIGQLGKVEEEEIEVVCSENHVEVVIDAIRKVHPYDEIPIFTIPLTMRVIKNQTYQNPSITQYIP